MPSSETGAPGPEHDPQLYQEEMLDAIDGAREAIEPLEGQGVYEAETANPISKHHASEEFMRPDRNGPSLDFDKDVNGGYRADTRIEKDLPSGGRVAYHAYSGQRVVPEDSLGPEIRETYGAVRVSREAENGQVYEHRFKSAEAGQKFNTLMAGQIAKRARAKTSEHKAA